ncbi:MAG TPA: acyl--CoA ligase [Kofleriaceae bacterium]|nr:acyl--CoA ligase [Kofleriaceae bacterium]
MTRLLEAGDDDATALTAPGGKPLTYRELRAVVKETIAALNAHGIGRHDRVAIVLDNGPHMASSFLAVAAGATSAPLNPGYRAEEFEFYMTDLRAGLLIVEAGKTSPAIDVATKLGIPIARLVANPERGAGAFSLEIPTPHAEAKHPGPAEPDDVALVLHTSGTTSRPKIVPLSQRNICTSAHNIKTTLRLTRSDRALNIMPLFHIHGLIAGTMAPLSVGASISCTPGFNALKFFGWMAEARPTFYTAVPTMHQAILMRAGQHGEIIKANPLRFIRSSSSSLAPQVLHELEATFGAPVVEAYGMTEAAHQMACNPLPPGERKPGTVGIAAGPEVCILGDDGHPAPAGTTGEISIRGPNVMKGYENNPKANAEAFTNGWFRTGDQGVMDDQGYISLTGRLKEIINRGGEKISPREVDEVLMDHPAVQQCVTFAMPHDKLGEEVAVVVVLREGVAATDDELRDFAGKRLANFKVPKKVIFMPEIPKGATGKLQRIGLAQKLGLA